jgi:hypothetical protein
MLNLDDRYSFVQLYDIDRQGNGSVRFRLLHEEKTNHEKEEIFCNFYPTQNTRREAQCFCFRTRLEFVFCCVLMGAGVS